MKAAAFLCLLIIVGCAGTERRIESLKNTSSRYENAILWGYYERAHDFINTGEDGGSPPDFERLREVKVTSYEILKNDISEDGLTANQTVEIKYYNINNMIEKTLLNEQRWEYDREKKKWFQRAGFPDFRQ